MNEFLKSILDGIYSLVSNYGLSVVLFTIVIRLCLMPLDYKSRVGMRKMSKLAPQQAALQKKYANDQEKLQRKLGELYQKEKVSPMSSCWPLLLSMPIMIAMFNALRMMANEELIKQTLSLINGADPKDCFERFLWITNLWMPDSPFGSAWPTLESLKIIAAEDWLRVIEQPEFAALLPDLGTKLGITLDAAAFSKDSLAGTVQVLGDALKALPAYVESNTTVFPVNLILFNFNIVKGWNGLFLLPLISFGTQLLMTRQQPASSAPATTGPDGKPQQPGGGAFMKWFFPLFSLWICAGYNAAFALYWVTANLVSMLQTYLINKHLDRKEVLEAVAEATTGKGGLH